MEIKSLITSDAPAPGGHYSQAIIHNGLIYVSGQLPIDPRTGDKCLGSIEDQTALVLTNIRGVLRAAGSDLDRVLRMTVYVADIGHWGKVNEIYALFMGEHRPARSVVPVKDLHYGFQIEIDAIAAVGDDRGAA